MKANYEDLIEAKQYSTDEVEVGTWYNGKKMYRRILNFAMTGAASTTTTQNINLSSWGITTICFIQGTEYFGSGSALPYPYYTSATDFGVAYFNMGSKIFTVRYQYNDATGRYLVFEITYLKD